MIDDCQIWTIVEFFGSADLQVGPDGEPGGMFAANRGMIRQVVGFLVRKEGVMMNRLAFAVITVAVATVYLSAQQTAKPPARSMSAMKQMSDQEIIKLASSAAPADISANATIVDHGEGGKARQLRAGTNGWVCMAHPEVMCLDKQWQEWADAWMNKRNPKISAVGVGYMLQGDTGASNTDPYATTPSANNQWVVSPSHVMVLTPDVKQLDALPTDPRNGGPWVMWKGTPYAHIMVPTVRMPKK